MSTSPRPLTILLSPSNNLGFLHYRRHSTGYFRFVSVAIQAYFFILGADVVLCLPIAGF
jgi:hypothetical protein